jgi:hypothetical protein
MGDKSSGNSKAADRATDAQMRLSEKLVRQSDPLRQQLFANSADFLRGDFDVSSLPQYGAGKEAIEQQFGRAQDQLIAGTPEGGGLTDALGNLGGVRAGSLVNLQGALGEAETNRALQLGTFGAAQGSSGFSSAGNIQAQLAQAEAQQNAGKASGLGSAGGSLAAAQKLGSAAAS